MSFVDTCVIAAGSGPTKGTLDAVRERADQRFSHEMGFRWKCHLLKTQTFRGNTSTGCSKNGIPGHSWRQREIKKQGENSSLTQNQKHNFHTMMQSCPINYLNTKEHRIDSSQMYFEQLAGERRDSRLRSNQETTFLLIVFDVPVSSSLPCMFCWQAYQAALLTSFCVSVAMREVVIVVLVCSFQA